MNAVDIVVDFSIAPDLPPMHTAIAEWLACIVCILPLRKRLKAPLLCVVLSAMLPALLFVHRLRVTTPYWTPFMALGLLIMLLGIWLCCKISFYDAGYYWTRAFLAAEFAASLEWVIYYYIMVAQSRINRPLSYFVMGVTYLIVFGGILLLQRRRQKSNSTYGVGPRDFWSAVVIALAVFAIRRTSLALDAEYAAGLCAGCNIDFGFSVDGGNFERTAENGLWYGQQEVVNEVVAIA